MESMILTPRLACMAALVPPNTRLADIGTDHGKLPISLLLDGHITSAIGSDIRSGPLAHAERNAKEHNVSLSLRLAPGLEAGGCTRMATPSGVKRCAARTDGVTSFSAYAAVHRSGKYR